MESPAKCPLCAITGLDISMKETEHRTGVGSPMWMCPKCWVLMSEDTISQRWDELNDHIQSVKKTVGLLKKYSTK